MNTETEIWRAVVGFENVYEVSDLGLVKRVGKNHGAQVNRILKPWVSNTGYLCVTLYKNSSIKFLVHRLVAIAFLPNPEGKRTVNHKNGIKTDCNILNLEWCTDKENTTHAHDILGVFRGEKNPASKLLDSDIPKILRLKKLGKTQGEIAYLFKVSQQTISRIVLNNRWRIK